MPAREVAGTVFLDDTPAAGATVRLVARRGVFHASVQTDASGRFGFGPVPVAVYRVIAEVPRATGTAINIDLHDPLIAADQLRLIVHACDAFLHGVVRDASGGVVGAARVFASEPFNVDAVTDEGPGTEAGEDGAYELCVPVGNSIVVVQADGYADALAMVSAFGPMRRDFELVPEAVVAGRTVRADDGAPVAGARLTLQAEAFTAMQHVPTLHAVSDTDGMFRFRGVAPGTYSLLAKADHFISVEPLAVETDLAKPAEGLECKLVPAFTIAGRVVEKSSKTPVSGRELWALDLKTDGVREQATSRSDGSFLFENLPPGDYRILEARSMRDGALAQVKVNDADVAGVTVEVDALASIAGRVTHAGRPVDGASVQAHVAESRAQPGRSSAMTTTDADGRFVLRELRAGSYRVYAESKRVGAFTRGPLVTIREAEQKAGVEVELDLAGSIAGKVVDQTGAPVAGAHLRFSLIQGRDFGAATTADDGTFRVAALSGGGEYMFEVRPTAHSTLRFRPAKGTRFTPVALRDGHSRVTGVQIAVQFERLAIRGRVIASDGSGVPDVVVTAARKRGRGFMQPTATTDANGAFVIEDLPAGQYDVLARSLLGAARATDVAAGAENVELRLPALGAIEGVLEGFATQPSVVASPTGDLVTVRPLRATVTGTKFVFERVPVGTYQVVAMGNDGMGRASATVAANSTTRVVLRNPGVGRIEGRVVRETTREPVANITCVSSMSAAETDESGRFRLETVEPGTADVTCYGANAQAHARVVVTTGKTAHVEVIAKTRTPTRAYAGLDLEIRGGDVAVKKVVPAGPADRAGVESGDVVLEIDQLEVDAMQGPQGVLNWIEAREPGDSVTLKLERDGKELVVLLKLEQRP